MLSADRSKFQKMNKIYGLIFTYHRVLHKENYDCPDNLFIEYMISRQESGGMCGCVFPTEEKMQVEKRVDIKGFEPLTFSMQSRRSTTDLNALFQRTRKH